jgi:hypothetical protein
LGRKFFALLGNENKARESLADDLRDELMQIMISFSSIGAPGNKDESLNKHFLEMDVTDH